MYNAFNRAVQQQAVFINLTLYCLNSLTPLPPQTKSLATSTSTIVLERKLLLVYLVFQFKDTIVKLNISFFKLGIY